MDHQQTLALVTKAGILGLIGSVWAVISMWRDKWRLRTRHKLVADNLGLLAWILAIVVLLLFAVVMDLLDPVKPQ